MYSRRRDNKPKRSNGMQISHLECLQEKFYQATCQKKKRNFIMRTQRTSARDKKRAKKSVPALGCLNETFQS